MSLLSPGMVVFICILFLIVLGCLHFLQRLILIISILSIDSFEHMVLETESRNRRLYQKN
jgi:hypothetical protein